MAKLGRKQYLGWLNESVPGTAVAIANSNYHLVEDVSVEFSGDEHERVGNMGSLDYMKGVTGSITASISFTTELKGPGSDTEPKDFPLWKASGFKEDESAMPYTLDQDDTPIDTVTIRYFADGMQWDFKGCVGTAVITMESGAIGKVAWTFTGMCDGMPADGTNPSPSYSTTVPPVCQNLSMTLDGGTGFGVCSSLSFDLGNEIANRRDMSETFGYAVPQITRRASTGSMTVEIPTSSAYNWQNQWQGKAKIDGAITVGSVEFNKTVWAWDMCITGSPTISDSDGILTYEIPFQLITDDLAGNNALSIQYA